MILCIYLDYQNVINRTAILLKYYIYINRTFKHSLKYWHVLHYWGRCTHNFVLCKDALVSVLTRFKVQPLVTREAQPKIPGRLNLAISPVLNVVSASINRHWITAAHIMKQCTLSQRKLLSNCVIADLFHLQNPHSLVRTLLLVFQTLILDTCLVSLFQWVQNFLLSLSTSRLGTYIHQMLRC